MGWVWLRGHGVAGGRQKSLVAVRPLVYIDVLCKEVRISLKGFS